MSRTLPSRMAATGLLTLTAAATGLVLAPSASAAESPAVTLSTMTVAPGEEFTVSGTGCVRLSEDYDPLVIVMSEEGEIAEAVEPAVDGSWTVTTSFPTDTPAGSIGMAAGCDQDYEEGQGDEPGTVIGFGYAEWTMTVAEAEVGAIRGVEANTPGTAAVENHRTSTSAAPGKEVVRIIEGFQPHEVVTLVMHSTPVILGTFTADAQGLVTAEFTVPADAAAGTHTLVFEGNMGTYFQESFTVTAAATGKQLAHTGGDVAVPLTVGLGLVAAGAGALVVSRRRTAGATQA